MRGGMRLCLMRRSIEVLLGLALGLGFEIVAMGSELVWDRDTMN